MCEDDRPDTTFLGNPWFWLILAVCAAIEAIIVWVVLT